MSHGSESDHVESSFTHQLQSMKWKFTTGNAPGRGATGREGRREVLLLVELRRGHKPMSFLARRRA